jgi:hypothetical protein
MKNNNISIDFISATNKLKDFIALEKEKEKEKKDKMDYKERKKMGIQICSNFVTNDARFSNWNTFFSKHQKKDDLSDCFLQGMWYIKHNKNVYECPCCFCFHLTSRDNWKEEFVSFELFDKMRIEYAETKNHLDGAKKKIEAQATQLNQMQKSFEDLRNKKIVYCQ